VCGCRNEGFNSINTHTHTHTHTHTRCSSERERVWKHSLYTGDKRGMCFVDDEITTRCCEGKAICTMLCYTKYIKLSLIRQCVTAGSPAASVLGRLLQSIPIFRSHEGSTISILYFGCLIAEFNIPSENSIWYCEYCRYLLDTR
jgi:hypothetical protein